MSSLYFCLMEVDIQLAKGKRGRPVTHPKVLHIETGNLFNTYKDAGESIGGSRHGVRRCCEGTQKHHHGNHFRWFGIDLNRR